MRQTISRVVYLYVIFFLAWVCFDSSEQVVAKDDVAKRMTTKLRDLKPVLVPPTESDESLIKLFNRLNVLVEASKDSDIGGMIAYANNLPDTETELLSADVIFHFENSKVKKGVSALTIRRQDGWNCLLNIDLDSGAPSSYTEGGDESGQALMIWFQSSGLPKALMTTENGKLFGRQSTWSADGALLKNENVTVPRAIILIQGRNSPDAK